ncbi:MAG: helix-turn-helix domain-containing protein [Victivallaceae bacterium]|nr:helix-turn-helix domain-containing protein [Victivallaceae bacterium]
MMVLPDKKKRTAAEGAEVYTQGQLSLDLDLPEDGLASTEPEVKKTAPAADGPEADSGAGKKKKKNIRKKNPPRNDFEEVYLDIGVGSLGKYLQDMRVKNNYSIAQVEQITRIKSIYIELLEMEKLQLELPSVYVLAYARKLCACYKVPENEADAIINELKTKLDRSFPHGLITNINIDYEIDEDRQKKLRHLAWLLLGALCLFVALIGIAVFMLVTPGKPPAVEPSVPLTVPEKFDQEKLRVLQPPVIIEATELPAKTAD